MRWIFGILVVLSVSAQVIGQIPSAPGTQRKHEAIEAPRTASVFKRALAFLRGKRKTTFKQPKSAVRESEGNRYADYNFEVSLADKYWEVPRERLRIGETASFVRKESPATTIVFADELPTDRVVTAEQVVELAQNLSLKRIPTTRFTACEDVIHEGSVFKRFFVFWDIGTTSFTRCHLVGIAGGYCYQIMTALPGSKPEPVGRASEEFMTGFHLTDASPLRHRPAQAASSINPTNQGGE